MSQAEGSQGPPLALAVLREEMAALDAQFQALAQAGDAGERHARKDDLARSLDRYLRLEREVFYPVLERRGIDYADANASHERLRARVSELAAADEPAIVLDGAREALHAHRDQQERTTFPSAEQTLGDELPGLAMELEEVRNRMKGAYGV